MHLNTDFMLKEANRKMRLNEERTAVEHALYELRHSHPSVRQRLARTLIGVATWLEPSSYPLRSERKGAGRVGHRP